ncbi:hypothetical protein CORC01_07037 [Colletotrichum orchidophilum]|uniref:RING-CH-type domain-containing protein n=1 Tax=Colletotrichum orchidophilum TaxID=1209926 RepID=A0A1G4B8M5_9PEZI|nr:uncharacterized protein CORC01_07037 [Colletotrichum orchidophilum]OHE97622.1 hypothetical protein CORC01_07037 [Colletotrichum orchidophilum]
MDAAKPRWNWPSDLPPGNSPSAADVPGKSEPAKPVDQDQGHRDNPREQSQSQPKQRFYGPRTCRICFESVHPTFQEPNVMSGFMNSRPRPVYKSDDPDSGRLISPCKCKGSQRYVHEGCLQSWRYADSTATRHFFACPTCSYQYKLERLSWANRLQGTFAQILLTILIFVVSVFILGFIADPILNLWTDPMGAIADMAANVLDDIEAIHEPVSEMGEEPATWLEHFLKGFFSLGLLGFVKSLFAMTPWQWWNLRSSGILGTSGRRGGTGRARVENINLGLVVIGAATFLWGVWKGVRKFSASALQRASDRVFDVGGDDDEDEDIKED